MKAKRFGRSGGFTLLEVLVAFLVLALSLSVLMRILSQATALSRASARHQQALQLAQSKMAELVALPELSPERDSGPLTAPFRWQSEVQRWEFPDQSFDFDYQVLPYRVSVTVSWGPHPAERVELTTVRLVAEGNL